MLYKIDTYSSTEVAEIIGVGEKTICEWCDRGKYQGAFQYENGQWRIPKKHFKISIEDARKRQEFEKQLNYLNNSKGE